jgi:hypothetical protein
MYQRGLALNPNHPNLNFNLGVSYTFNADYGDAIKRFKIFKKWTLLTSSTLWFLYPKKTRINFLLVFSSVVGLSDPSNLNFRKSAQELSTPSELRRHFKR